MKNMKTVSPFMFKTIKPQEELSTRQRAQAIAQYMQEDTPHEKLPIKEEDMKVKTTPEILEEFADLSRVHEWNRSKQELRLYLHNSAYIKVKPWGEALVTIKTKNFVYDAEDLRELAEELAQLASMMEKRHD